VKIIRFGSSSQGTPTRSPSRSRLTPGPSASNTSTSRWPGTTGRFGSRNSPSTMRRSVVTEAARPDPEPDLVGPRQRGRQLDQLKGRFADRPRFSEDHCQYWSASQDHPSMGQGEIQRLSDRPQGRRLFAITSIRFAAAVMFSCDHTRITRQPALRSRRSVSRSRRRFAIIFSRHQAA